MAPVVSVRVWDLIRGGAAPKRGRVRIGRGKGPCGSVPGMGHCFDPGSDLKRNHVSNPGFGHGSL